jgi:hypothetical protein
VAKALSVRYSGCTRCLGDRNFADDIDGQPVLHLGEKRILKHRVNRSILEQTLEAWYQAHQEPNLEKQAQAAEQKDQSQPSQQ